MAARRRPQRSRSERHECRNVTGGTPWVGAAWRSAWWLWEARASAPRISSSMRLAELAAVDRCTVQFIRTWCSLVPASLRACGSRVYTALPGTSCAYGASLVRRDQYRGHQYRGPTDRHVHQTVWPRHEPHTLCRFSDLAAGKDRHRCRGGRGMPRLPTQGSNARPWPRHNSLAADSNPALAPVAAGPS